MDNGEAPETGETVIWLIANCASGEVALLPLRELKKANGEAAHFSAASGNTAEMSDRLQ